MKEEIINLGNISLNDFYGKNNKNVDTIVNYFPKLKITFRDREVIISGKESELEFFKEKITSITEFLKRNNNLSTNHIEQLIESDTKSIFLDDIIQTYNGKIIKPNTINQAKLVNYILNKDMVFVVGPAGTGKTYLSVALAVKFLKEKRVKKIIFTRPAVEAGENLGFLPGDLKEKLDPYLQPLYDALRDMIPNEKLKEYIEKEIIQIAPLAFMRGRTLSDAFVILDEGQNTTSVQMKMFLTRMGKNSKFVITGDIGQIDLPKNQNSGLIHSLKILKDIKEIGFMYLDGKDIIRHKIVRKIIEKYDK